MESVGGEDAPRRHSGRENDRIERGVERPRQRSCDDGVSREIAEWLEEESRRNEEDSVVVLLGLVLLHLPAAGQRRPR